MSSFFSASAADKHFISGVFVIEAEMTVLKMSIVKQLIEIELAVVLCITCVGHLQKIQHKSA